MEKVSADELPWPIDSPHFISSSFGEPRSGRFHLGVDFKSGRITGKRVFALGNGYISRVTTSPYGYGKMLCIKLDTGETILYGHLSEFLPEIEKELLSLRKIKDSYDVEFIPASNRYRVKSGEVIAWSGDTGSGPPHLHIEIHDKAGSIINPLVWGVDVKDTIPPVIKSIVFIPLEYGSLVNGLPLPFIIDREQFKPVSLRGKIGVAASTWDMTDGSENILGNYKFTLYTDSLLFFEKIYGTISSSDTGFGGLDYFNGNRYGINEVLSALFRRTGNLAGFYQKNGFLDSNNTKLSTVTALTLSAVDFSGNSTKKTIPVSFRQTPSIKFCGYDVSKKIKIEGNNPEGKKAFLEIYKHACNDSWKIIEKKEVSGKNFTLFTDLPSTNTVYRFTVATEDSAESIPVKLQFGAADVNTGSLEISAEMIHYGYILYVKSNTPLSSTPVMEVYSNAAPYEKQKIFCTQEDDNTWIASLKPGSPAGTEIAISVKAYDSSYILISAEKKINFSYLEPFLNSWASSSDSAVTLYSPPGSLFRATPVEINPAGEVISKNLNAASKGYSILFGDDVFRKSIRVNFKAFDLKSTKTAVFYSVSGNNGPWNYLSVDKSKGIFTCFIKGSCTVAAFEDTIPPSMKIIYPIEGQTVSDSIYVKISLSDNGSGIAGSESFKMSFDGEEVYAEYDYEADTLTWKPLKKPSPGKHEVMVKTTDRTGNISECSWYFNTLENRQ